MQHTLLAVVQQRGEIKLRRLLSLAFERCNPMGLTESLKHADYRLQGLNRLNACHGAVSKERLRRKATVEASLKISQRSASR